MALDPPSARLNRFVVMKTEPAGGGLRPRSCAAEIPGLRQDKTIAAQAYGIHFVVFVIVTPDPGSNVWWSERREILLHGAFLAVSWIVALRHRGVQDPPAPSGGSAAVKRISIRAESRKSRSTPMAVHAG